LERRIDQIRKLAVSSLYHMFKWLSIQNANCGFISSTLALEADALSGFHWYPHDNLCTV
jgi:hypothetical protein